MLVIFKHAHEGVHGDHRHTGFHAVARGIAN